MAGRLNCNNMGAGVAAFGNFFTPCAYVTKQHNMVPV